MKRHILTTVFCCLGIMGAGAWEYADIKQTEETTLQLRLDFTYTHRFKHGLSLSVFEDLRLDMLPFNTATLFDLSLTSLTFAYSPIPYLKTDVGYMLKLQGASSAETKTAHWQDANGFIRHRLYTGVTGSYQVAGWRFSLRERLLCDMRFDEIDPVCTARYSLTLRHYLNVSYSVADKGITPYLWTELANTLNQKEYCRKNGHQYLERWRTSVGVKWKIPTEDKSKGTLNFFYRYDWGSFRSAQVSGDDILLTIRRKNEHAIGIGYEL